jgi:hypothetical protein
MSEDSRHSGTRPVSTSEVSADAQAIIDAISNGWFRRGIALAAGFFVFWLTVGIVCYVLFRPSLP